MSRERELEFLARIIDALRVSHELTQALAGTRDGARRGDDVTSDVQLCVDVARSLLAATLRAQELVGRSPAGGS